MRCLWIMFVTAVCFLFLLKLKWPKNKNIYDAHASYRGLSFRPPGFIPYRGREEFRDWTFISQKKLAVYWIHFRDRNQERSKNNLKRVPIRSIRRFKSLLPSSSIVYDNVNRNFTFLLFSAWNENGDLCKRNSARRYFGELWSRAG